MRSEHPELARPPKRCFLLFGHPCRLFLGPGFWLVARWNRLGEAVKTRKKREKNGEEMGEIWPKKCGQGRDRRLGGVGRQRLRRAPAHGLARLYPVLDVPVLVDNAVGV